MQSISLLKPLTGRDAHGILERGLMSLPFQPGGLNKANPFCFDANQYSSSVLISTPIVDSKIAQGDHLSI